ncbi:RHS repeat protein [Treponema sp. OMZ 840]|uniref:RHS repeat domain-containing protein n=1 Tax=Treponema sp. OMZ 840 TaxID=244313 RepID=UPI003D948C76
MKKNLSVLIALCVSILCSAQNFTIPKADLRIGKEEPVPSIVSGQVIYAGEDVKTNIKSSMDIPEELANGVVIIRYRIDYYYKNKIHSSDYQLLYSNIIPDAKFTQASIQNPISIEANEILGIGNDTVSVVIRIGNLDPHLVLCAQHLPLQVSSYWYYGVESLTPTVAKYLTFRPVLSKRDTIVFPDGISQSLEEIVTKTNSSGADTFPAVPIKIKTVMNAYPAQKHQITDASEKIIHNQYFNNLNLEALVEFDGLKIHIYFPENFAQYFSKEYKLGDPIWFYGNIVYVMNNELHMYGRDFVLEDPDETVIQRQNLIIQMNRQAQNLPAAQKGEKEEDSFVDVTQTIPKGGYATYQRFFVKDEVTGKFNENKANIEENYFDKNGNKVARMMWYDETDMIRNTQTFKYDTKGRLVEACFYDSKMFKEDGKWKVDPKRSRIFNKHTTVYTDTKDGTDAVTTALRYSYVPTTEHPDYVKHEKYNAAGKLIRSETKYGHNETSVSLYEYDNFGNILYQKDNTDKEFEYKFEYVYDGEKVIKGIGKNLLEGEVFEWTCEYDAKGNVIQKTYPNLVYNYRYNKNGKLSEMTCKDKDGNVKEHKIYRYDKKTGIPVLEIEDADYGTFKICRFWYIEFSKSNWKDDLDPWLLAKELDE